VRPVIPRTIFLPLTLFGMIVLARMFVTQWHFRIDAIMTSFLSTKDAEVIIIKAFDCTIITASSTKVLTIDRINEASQEVYIEKTDPTDIRRSISCFS
jgi:uncharacterized protein YhaN